jgi:hypothetical protein
MNPVVPIMPVAGVPDELIRVLNDRFRFLVDDVATAAPAAPSVPAAPPAAIARPGVVSFSPKRTNYGEISVGDIVVRDNPDPGGILQLQICALYVDEVRISQYATVGGMLFDPENPEANDSIVISATEHDVGVEQWGNFEVGDLCILNDVGTDYVSPAVAGAAWAPLTAGVDATSTTLQVGVPTSTSSDAMPTSGGFFALVDAEFISVGSVSEVRDGGANLTGYIWTGCLRHQMGTTAAAHLAGSFAYHLTNLSLSKYEIFLITAISEATGAWTIRRHFPGDAPGRAMFGSRMSSHSGGKKAFKLNVKHDTGAPRPIDASVRPPAAAAPGETGGSSMVIPDCTMELPHACVAAVMAAAVNASGTGPWTVYNCAQLDNLSDRSLPVLPGIRTLDGSSYTLPQFVGPVSNGLSMPIPWSVQVWASLRCAYCYVGKASTGQDFGGRGITEVQLQIRYLDDGYDADGKPLWSIVSRMFIDASNLRSWDWRDYNPNADGSTYPPPTLYNNPYFVQAAGDETGDEHDWPQWSHPQDGIFRFHRSLEGDALLRWIVIDNGSSAPTSALDGNISDRTNNVKLTSNLQEFANGDYIQIDDEKLLISYDGGTQTVVALRGVLGTIPAAHLSGAVVSGISAGGAVDLSVALQT